VSFSQRIRPFVDAELSAARACAAAGDDATAFGHLERAHVAGQAATTQHVRVHWAMLRWGLARRDAREVFGQLFRIAGAATKTVFGLVPQGNTGGANVSAVKPMPIPPDLAEVIAVAQRRP